MQFLGYGIDLTKIDIELVSTDNAAKRLLDFIKQAPKFYETFKEWYADRFLDGENFDEVALLNDIDAYTNMTKYEDEDLRTGLHVIMREVIQEKEDINLYASYGDAGSILMLEPKFPWTPRGKKERGLTKEALDDVYRRYVNQLGNVSLDIDNIAIEE